MGHLNQIRRVWALKETNYDGGEEGALHSQTVPTAADTLTIAPHLVGTNNFKAVKYNRERIALPGNAIGTALTYTKSLELPDIEFSYLLQTAVDPFKSQVVTDTAVKGVIGESFIIQVMVANPSDDGADTYLWYNFFGCQLTHHSITANYGEGDPPIVTVKFICYGMAEALEAQRQTTATPTTVVTEWEDCTLTIDGKAITEAKSYTWTTTREFSARAPVSPSFVQRDPRLLDMKLELQVEFYNDEAGLMQYETVAALTQDLECDLTDGTNTLNVTNCYVDNTNFMEGSSDDLQEESYTVTLISAESVFT